MYGNACGKQYNGDRLCLKDVHRKGRDLTKQTTLVTTKTNHKTTKTDLSPPSNLIRAPTEKQSTQKRKKKPSK